jgi:hypothetical protein
MSAHVITANVSFHRTGKGSIRPNLAPLCWLMVVIGLLGVALGLYGSMMMIHLQETATVTIQGMSGLVFQKLVFGSLILSSIGALGLFRGLSAAR